MKISIETFTYKKVYICVILNLVYILSETTSIYTEIYRFVMRQNCCYDILWLNIFCKYILMMSGALKDEFNRRFYSCMIQVDFVYYVYFYSTIDVDDALVTAICFD